MLLYVVLRGRGEDTIKHRFTPAPALIKKSLKAAFINVQSKWNSYTPFQNNTHTKAMVISIERRGRFDCKEFQLALMKLT